MTSLIDRKFDFTCPKCEAKLVMTPSIFMDLGQNCGGGEHKACGANFTLRLEPDLQNPTHAVAQMLPTIAELASGEKTYDAMKGTDLWRE